LNLAVSCGNLIAKAQLPLRPDLTMHSTLKSYFHEITGAGEEKLAALAQQPLVFLHVFFHKVLREGEVCKFNYFVVSGCLRLYSVNPAGIENTRYIAFEKKFAASFTSLITGQPSMEYIQSLENTTVLAITRQDFFDLVEREPAVNKVYRHILESAYITTQKRIYDLQGADSLHRLKWLLAQQPRVFERLPGKIIASYLGITPYTLSRLKADLKK
jgi:CRP-like cAMP-binding protein